MLQNIQKLNRGQRLLVFILLFGGIVLIFLTISAVLVLDALNTNPRLIAAPLTGGVTVREFATLPDDDAYPSSVAVAPDGRVFTGSYKTGAVYVITPDGQAQEIPGTREAIGAAAGLAFAPDGALLVVDHVDADVRTSGGDVKRLSPGGQVTTFAVIPDERGFVLPYKIALDERGFVYVTDRGRDEVWRFNPDGSGGVLWWSSPPEDEQRGYDPTGLAYDPARRALIVADGAQNVIYRVSILDGDTEVLYRHSGADAAPGFDGLAVSPGGDIYAAALGINRVARVSDGTLMYLAGPFRGASDVAYAAPNRLYVTNFDQFSLVVPAVGARLPFALDVIELGAGG